MTIPVSDEVRRLLLEEAMHTRRRAGRVGSRQLVEEPVRGGIEPLEMLLAAQQLAILLRTGSTTPPRRQRRMRLMMSKAEVCVVLAAMIIYSHASLSVIHSPNLRIVVTVFFSVGRVSSIMQRSEGMTYGPRAIFVDYEGRSRRRSRGLVVRVAGRSVSFARIDRTDKFGDACVQVVCAGKVW